MKINNINIYLQCKIIIDEQRNQHDIIKLIINMLKNKLNIGI